MDLTVTSLSAGVHDVRISVEEAADRPQRSFLLPIHCIIRHNLPIFLTCTSVCFQIGTHRESCNFSFSGIKTSVAKLIETERLRLGLPAQLYSGPGATTTTGEKVLPPSAAGAGGGGSETSASVPEAEGAGDGGDTSGSRDKVDEDLHRSLCLIAAGFQRVSVRFLQQRTRRALQWLAEDAAQLSLQQQHGGGGGAPPVSCLVVAGGVAANRTVRAGLEAVAAEYRIPCVCPPVQHCTDNGLMVAWTGVERLRLGLWRAPPLDEGAVMANVDVLPRWPIGPVDPRSAATGMKHIKAFK